MMGQEKTDVAKKNPFSLGVIRKSFGLGRSKK